MFLFSTHDEHPSSELILSFLLRVVENAVEMFLFSTNDEHPLSEMILSFLLRLVEKCSGNVFNLYS